MSRTFLIPFLLVLFAVIGWGPDSALASGNIIHQVISDQAIGMIQNPQLSLLLKKNRDAYRTGVLHPDVADHGQTGDRTPSEGAWGIGNYGRDHGRSQRKVHEVYVAFS